MNGLRFQMIIYRFQVIQTSRNHSLAIFILEPYGVSSPPYIESKWNLHWREAKPVPVDETEDIWVFQCKVEFYFTEWTPQAVFSRVAVATSENTDCGVHEWNKIQSYTEKKSNFLFRFCFYLQ